MVVGARTGGPGGKGLTLLVVETEGAEGYRRGRNLDKIACTRQIHRSCSSTMSRCRRKTCS